MLPMYLSLFIGMLINDRMCLCIAYACMIPFKFRGFIDKNFNPIDRIFFLISAVYLIYVMSKDDDYKKYSIHFHFEIHTIDEQFVNVIK